MSNPRTSGPNGDGSKSLAPESKVGLTVGGILFVVLQVVVQGLTSLDTSGWSGTWVPLANGVIATVIGLITAYQTRNR